MDDRKIAVTSFIRQYGIVLLFGLLGIFFLGVGIFQSMSGEQEEIIFQQEVETQIYVDVSGAVINPGVYPIQSPSRLQDAVISAGGLHVDADREYLSRSVNMARLVEDGEKIYIPFEGEMKEEVLDGGDVELVVSDRTGGLINLNTAPESELDSLPGVGPVTIGKIVNGRPYGSVDELMERDIVGQATFEKIEDLVSVN